ncbi:MAG: polysaccharide deacetylase family protein [Dehalococcoidia bacterium]|nr:polysaccharide deacetylase family protein [Dehalococcoidia bacterium]
MDGRLSRRRLLGLGATGIAAAAGLGIGAAIRESRNTPPGDEVLVIDEADPTATPYVFTATALPATATPTLALPTATPSPTRGPRLMRRPAWTSDILGQVATSGPADRPLCALTIDDGWYSRDEVLAVLQQQNVQLTFFLAGRPIAGDHGFIARALDAGFEIANHTMDHYDLIGKSAAYVQKDLADFEDLVRDMVTGATTVPYMRPSGGSLDQTVINASVAAGYRPILWSGSSGDGSVSTTPAQMTANVIAAARPGAIILMHFSERAVAALPGMIAGIRAKGLEPVSLSKLFEQAPGGI